MTPLVLLLVTATPCPELGPDASIALAVTSVDSELLGHKARVRQRITALAAPRARVLGPQATARALTAEGGARERRAAVLDARVQLERARAFFRDLDDERGLATVADVISRLVPVQQAEGAIELLARAHVLAAAIYLARGEGEAVKARLHRALDLDDDVSASPQRFDPRLFAELAAAAESRRLRPTGRIEVQRADHGPPAEVFVDGRAVGTTPVALDAIPAGRHLLRVSAPGRLSEASSVLVRASETTRRQVRLRPDPERIAMRELAGTLRAGEDPGPALSLLQERSGATIALVAELVLTPRRTAVGTATVAVRLWSSAGGTGWAEDTRAENLAVAVASALGCGTVVWPALRAPALLGPARPVAALEAVPPRAPWWRAPWVWAIGAGLALGAAGALVATRANSGPAEAISITLVPRP